MNTKDMRTMQPVYLPLPGLDGNAFAILGAFKQAARKQGRDPDQIRCVLDEAMSGDYDHLLCVIIDNTTDEQEDA